MNPTYCQYEPTEPLDEFPHHYRCSQCGHERRSEYAAGFIRRRCPKGKNQEGSKKIPDGTRILLGDRVEMALSAIGVTKERVEKILRRPCNCKERQRKLNELHLWAERWTGKIFRWRGKKKAERQLSRILKKGRDQGEQ